MNHLDLFSGIGGFALAAQTVWGEDYRCVGFCEIDPFCQQVLSKNFPGVQIYGDIRTLSAERLAADTRSLLRCGQSQGRCGNNDGARTSDTSDEHYQFNVDLLTGGFPCQPFSTAGKRKGTQDDRWLWPEMLRVIREVKPRWIIGENVAGIIQMALGQVCADLAELHYEVQCFVIPACAVNAPHRRDRVWIVANAKCERSAQCEYGDRARPGKGIPTGGDCPSPDAESAGREGRESEGRLCTRGCNPEYAFPDWSRDWREVATATCLHRVDDGLPRRMARLPDGSTISESRLRQNSLKAYGNAIVPQVAIEIMRAIKEIDNG